MLPTRRPCRPACPWCFYDTEKLGGPVCPECGHSYAIAKTKRRRQNLLLSIGYMLMSLALIGAFCFARSSEPLGLFPYLASVCVLAHITAAMVALPRVRAWQTLPLVAVLSVVQAWITFPLASALTQLLLFSAFHVTWLILLCTVPILTAIIAASGSRAFPPNWQR